LIFLKFLKFFLEDKLSMEYLFQYLVVGLNII
jgi:hypothetical protein